MAEDTDDGLYDNDPAHPLFMVPPEVLRIARQVLDDAAEYKDVDPESAHPLADAVVMAIRKAGYLKEPPRPLDRAQMYIRRIGSMHTARLGAELEAARTSDILTVEEVMSAARRANLTEALRIAEDERRVFLSRLLRRAIRGT